MSRFIGLLVLSIILITACALMALVVMPKGADGNEFDFPEAVWWSMTRIFDAGTVV